MRMFEKIIIKLRMKNTLRYSEARAQVIYDNPELVFRIPVLQAKSTGKTFSSVAGVAPVAPAIDALLKQQQEFFAKQQEQINIIQKQMVDLMTVILSKNEPKKPKRTYSDLDESSEDDDEDQPSKLRAPSNRQEVVNLSEKTSPPKDVDRSLRREKSTPSVSGKTTTEEAMEEDRGQTVGRESPKRPSKPPASSSAAPSAAVSSAPPPRTVKGGEKAGSSGPSGDRKSAVSNKKKTSISIITGPNTNKWKN